MPEAHKQSQPEQLVENFFRHETGRLHGALVRMLGVHRLQLAEDVAQEAMLRALRAWSMGGPPKNPSAWITRVAMNLAKDALRHERVVVNKEPAIVTHHEQMSPSPAVGWNHMQEIRDDQLRLMFVCAHPEIGADSQVVLALKVLCGFTTREIAEAFLSSEAAIEKQLTRTKKRIKELGVGFEIPEGEDLAPRLNGVLGAIYLLFNEGYKSTGGSQLLREDLCSEAIRLASILVTHPKGNTPASHALLALMLLNAARFPTRMDDSGAILRLDDQDRSKWDAAMIDRGLEHLARAAQGDSLTLYHLEAAIAATHCTARDCASTDWGKILRLYDELLNLRPSPIVALNRAVALARVEGPEAALEAIENLPQKDRLEGHYLYWAVLGEMHGQLGDKNAASQAYKQAIELVSVDAEREFLTATLGQLSESRKRLTR